MEVDVAGRAVGVEAVDHRAQPLAAVADVPGDRVPDLLGCEHPRLGDRHQVAEAVAALEHDLLLDPVLADLDQLREEPGPLVADGR